MNATQEERLARFLSAAHIIQDHALRVRQTDEEEGMRLLKAVLEMTVECTKIYDGHVRVQLKENEIEELKRGRK